MTNREPPPSPRIAAIAARPGSPRAMKTCPTRSTGRTPVAPPVYPDARHWLGLGLPWRPESRPVALPALHPPRSGCVTGSGDASPNGRGIALPETPANLPTHRVADPRALEGTGFAVNRNATGSGAILHVTAGLCSGAHSFRTGRVARPWRCILTARAEPATAGSNNGTHLGQATANCLRASPTCRKRPGGFPG